MKIFGFTILKNKDYEEIMSERDSYESDHISQSVEYEQIKEQLDIAREQLFKVTQENKNLKSGVLFGDLIIPLDTGDPEPTDTPKYRSFVGEAAGSYKNVWEDKLKHMIATSYGILEQAENEPRIDQSIKGAIYAFREMMRWGESMINKQLALQVENEPPEENKN